MTTANTGTIDTIECACGCGTTLSRLGRNGKPRRFMRGHQTLGKKFPKDDKYWGRRLGKLHTRAKACTCGCGSKVLVSMSWLREREGQRCVWIPRYKEGHMPYVFCVCGCGSKVPLLDSRNQQRCCVPSHAHKLSGPRKGRDWAKAAEEWNREAPSCACGCGIQLGRTAKQLRTSSYKAEFVQGHNRRRTSVPALTALEESVILGSLLGDLCITRPKETPRLCFTHGIDQEAYARHKMDVLHRLSWWSSVCPTSGYAPEKLGVRGSSSCLHVLEDIYQLVRSGPEGGKFVTAAWLQKLDIRSLAYWFMDDGSVGRSAETQKISTALIHTQGFSVAENRVLADWMCGQGFSTEVKIYDGRPCLYLDRQGVRPFFKAIRPFIHESMRYKVDGPFTH